MKKILITLCVMMMCGQMLAQTNDSIQNYIDSLENTINDLKGSVSKTKKKERDKSVWGRKKFLSIGYVSQNLSPRLGNDLEGSFGVSLTNGRTIYLHKKPIWGKLKFGLDLGVDINYTKYKDYEEDYNYYYEEETILSGMHQCDIGVLLGANVTVNPVSDLRVSAYFRFVPSYSMLILSGEMNGSYVSFFTYGGEVSWKCIGIGVEGRSGSGKYGAFFSDDEGGGDIKEKFCTNALRAYINFRF